MLGAEGSSEQQVLHQGLAAWMPLIDVLTNSKLPVAPCLWVTCKLAIARGDQIWDHSKCCAAIFTLFRKHQFANTSQNCLHCIGLLVYRCGAEAATTVAG